MDGFAAGRRMGHALSQRRSHHEVGKNSRQVKVRTLGFLMLRDNVPDLPFGDKFGVVVWFFYSLVVRPVSWIVVNKVVICVWNRSDHRTCRTCHYQFCGSLALRGSLGEASRGFDVGLVFFLIFAQRHPGHKRACCMDHCIEVVLLDQGTEAISV